MSVSMACRSPKAMGFDMAVVPYFRWEQLQDDDAKRKFLWETLPAQVLIINWALWGEVDCLIVMASFVWFCERGMTDDKCT